MMAYYYGAPVQKTTHTTKPPVMFSKKSDSSNGVWHLEVKKVTYSVDLSLGKE